MLACPVCPLVTSQPGKMVEHYGLVHHRADFFYWLDLCEQGGVERTITRPASLQEAAALSIVEPDLLDREGEARLRAVVLDPAGQVYSSLLRLYTRQEAGGPVCILCQLQLQPGEEQLMVAHVGLQPHKKAAPLLQIAGMLFVVV